MCFDGECGMHSPAFAARGCLMFSIVVSGIGSTGHALEG